MKHCGAIALRAAILVVVLAVTRLLVAQPAIVWQRTLSGTWNDQAYGITPLPDGGFAVAGFSRSSDGDFADHHGASGIYDCAAIRLDSNGTVVWKHSLGGSGHDYCPCVVRSHDGGLVYAGSAASSDGGFTKHRGDVGTSDAWIVKLDAAGRVVWSNTYGGTQNEGFSRIVAAGDGGYLAAGYSNSNDGDAADHHGATTTSDVWVVKIDSAGTLLWARSYGGMANDEAFGLTATDDSAFVVFGGTASQDGDVHGERTASNFWLVKIDPAGTLIWEHAFGSPHGEDMNSVVLASDGGYIAGGSAYYSGGDITTPHHGHNDSYDIWIIKVARDGSLAWQTSLGGTGHDYEQDVHATADGGCLVSGYSTSNDIDVSGHHGDTTQYDAWLAKLDRNGRLQWQRSLGGSGMDGASGIALANDGGMVLAANSSSTDGDRANDPDARQHGAQQCWIVKLAPMPTGVAQGAITPGGHIDLFPNPARTTIAISVRDVAMGDDATVDIIDMTGRIVSRVPAGPVQETMTIPIDASLSAGTYLVRLRDGLRELMAPRVVEVVR